MAKIHQSLGSLLITGFLITLIGCTSGSYPENTIDFDNSVGHSASTVNKINQTSLNSISSQQDSSIQNNDDNTEETNGLFEKDKIKEDWKETVVVNNCSVKDGPGNNYKDIGELQYGDTVLLLGDYNGWFLAKSDDIDEFWVEGKNVINYDYDENRTFGILTADKVSLGNISLYKGNLVWILKKDSGRSYVRPVAIDVNRWYSGWINNTDYTTAKKGVYFNQAFLKKDAKVYTEASEKSEIFKEFNELSGDYIFIDKVQDDGWMQISAWGGIGGWVQNKDVYLP